MPEAVSQRQAAAALGLAPATFRGVLLREPSLAAAIVGTGPRGARLFDLQRLRTAWQRLQGPDDPPGLSPRALYGLNRRRYLWWQLQALEGEVAAMEAGLADAAEVAAALTEARAEVAAAAREWAGSAEVLAVAGLPQAEARVLLQRSIVARLQQLASNGKPAPPAAAPPPATLPDPVPALWELKAAIEAARARQAELSHRQAVGELEPAEAAMGRFFAEARQKRDAWQQLGERLALQTRRLPTGESVRTVALQSLSAAGLG
ncbi:MAG: hypothetical protein VKJ05_03185 [Synechococcaceae cyanobacterium]|nr:hypothetical protein [Synechococcaceae cyanobacterium]